MSELTDLEICKKIADIEGFPEQVLEFHDDHILNYNPLTDKALCFDLMVKYKVELDFVSSYCACLMGEYEWGYNENPQKAICLAIIAKHNKE